MITTKKPACIVLYAFLFTVILQSCEKKDIDFATGLGDPYTNLTQVDSVGVNMSTFFVDSFATSNPATLLLGRYKDPVLGTISAKPFLQLSPPNDITIPPDAVYDSLTLVIKSSKYYYGDTTKPQTIEVHELDAPIIYNYGYSFYNKSSVAEKPTLLGSRQLLVRPNKDDSIIIRLNDAKGMELFNKMQLLDNSLLSQDAFLNYFRGISIGFSNGDSAAIYGITDSMYLRVSYHATTPYPQSLTKDFLWDHAGLWFNQLISDRSGTALAPLLSSGINTEIPASLLNNQGYTQGAAGVELKVTFPTVRNIIQNNPNIKILKATLILRVAAGTHDNYKLRIPESLFLATTDATNTIGIGIAGTTGSTALSYPIADNIYDTPAYYSFDITSFINTLINTAGVEDKGLFVIENSPGQNNHINRGIFSNSTNPLIGSQLLLTVLTIK